MCFSTEPTFIMGSSKSKTTSNTRYSKDAEPKKNHAQPISARLGLDSVSKKEVVVLKECRVKLERIDVPSEKSKSLKINSIQDKPPPVRTRRGSFHINLTGPTRKRSIPRRKQQSLVLLSDDSSMPKLTEGGSIVDHGNGKLEYKTKKQSIQFCKCSVALTRLDERIMKCSIRPAAVTTSTSKINKRKHTQIKRKLLSLSDTPALHLLNGGGGWCPPSIPSGKELFPAQTETKFVPLITVLRRVSSTFLPKLPHDIEEATSWPKFGLPLRVCEMPPSQASSSSCQQNLQNPLMLMSAALEKEFAIDFIKNHILGTSLNFDNDWDIKMDSLMASRQVNLNFGRADCLRGLELKPISNDLMISLDETFTDIMEVIKEDTSVEVPFDSCQSGCICDFSTQPDGQFPQADLSDLDQWVPSIQTDMEVSEPDAKSLGMNDPSEETPLSTGDNLP